MVEHLCGALYDPPIGPPVYARATSPHRRPYRTRDGYIAVMIYNDRQWRSFFEAIGNPDWSRQPMFASMASRTSNITAVLGHVAEVLAGRTTDEWMALFRQAECPAMPIASIEDLLTDPHLEATGFWQRRDSPDGTVRMPGIPVQFSDTPGAVGDPGPAFGADGRAVLRQAGLGEAEIDALAADGSLRLADR
jgi:crotonobetainyl-CoA:carnitine CoA-transferase CaiB-like acyl-CoA transferase